MAEYTGGLQPVHKPKEEEETRMRNHGAKMEEDLKDKTEQCETMDFQRDISSELSSSSDLQTTVAEEKEHLQVYLRIRPFTAAENSMGEAQDCVSMESSNTVLMKPPGWSRCARQSTACTERALLQTAQRFHFSQVQHQHRQQGLRPGHVSEAAVRGTVKELVRDVLTGANSLVFTYGVTNAGKTFTFLGPEADPGLLPRALSTIFNSIEERVSSDVSIRPHRCRDSPDSPNSSSWSRSFSRGTSTNRAKR
ncbi:hypothetical protein WMY93_000735 [Mugilogobius chulae]|uniref:Kinesin motor domain-containing protein n=1 Tax=Mugilogobius chulae TaxID=88201 RepID=A0AAW0Q2W1_9GOBI